MTPVHLVLGDSAAGSLRVACSSYGLPGEVIAVRDDLSHGPLVSEKQRIAYMRNCYKGFADWPSEIGDEFSSWEDVFNVLDRKQYDIIVIGSGDNVSESTFLAAACWHLRDRVETVHRVAMPEQDEPPYVALHRPEELAALYAGHQSLTDGERRAQAEDYLRIRGENQLLRKWEAGRIVSLPIDHYDTIILNACSNQWQRAARVIGAAMGQCDPHNLMSDLFFGSRLQVLIDQGKIEAEGIRRKMSDYSVRCTLQTSSH